jgi:hypothetical protein
MRNWKTSCCLLLCVSLAFFGASARATEIPVNHTQNTLAEELLGSAPIFSPSDKATREFSIFNNTGKHWSQYDMRLEDAELDMSDGFSFDTTSFNGTNSFFDFVIFHEAKDAVWFKGGSGVDPSETFVVTLRIIDDTSPASDGVGPVNALGGPASAVPEPSTLVLAALGLFSLSMIGRRRRNR